MSKKTIRNTIFFIIAVILVLAATVLINFYPLFSMTPAETGVIDGTEIIAVRNNKNDVFLIKSDSGYIVIDAGTNKDAVQKALGELSINTADVKHVLLTHSDYDHVGALPLFAGAQIHMSGDEQQMVNGNTKRSVMGYNSLPESVEISDVNLIADEQELNLDGNSVRCIKAPGHTPGSMCYIVNGKYLFTGDALRIENSRMSLHPFTMDEEEAQSSIERIKEVKRECELLLTAHYGYFNSESLE